MKPLLSGQDRLRLSGPRLRTFLNICKNWKLDHDQQAQILAISPEELQAYRNQALDPDQKLLLPLGTLLQVAHVLGIHKALAGYFGPQSPSMKEWIHKPNQAQLFQGEPALKMMLQGRVDTVRAYLEAQLW